MSNNNYKISICYFGMTRSTRFVYESHYNNVFNILKNNNIEFDIYIHSWKTDKNLIWSNEVNIPNDYEEYKFLNPTIYQLDVQDDFLKNINMEDYFNEELFNIYGGNTHDEWWPQLIRNHLCALESQKRVTEICLNTNKKYDFIMYIRPDVQIYDPFPLDCLKNIKKNDIIIPNNEHHEGYNDRFAVIPFNNCEKYGKRIDEIKEFRKSQGRIVSEKYVKYIINKYYENIHFIQFDFKIIRPNGKH